MLEKVDEPKGTDTNWCQRCDRDHCVNCVSMHEVTFDIDEEINLPNGVKHTVVWTNEEVCPWCYNQLIDLKNKQEEERKCPSVEQ